MNQKRVYSIAILIILGIIATKNVDALQCNFGGTISSVVSAITKIDCSAGLDRCATITTSVNGNNQVGYNCYSSSLCNANQAAVNGVTSSIKCCDTNLCNTADTFNRNNGFILLFSILTGLFFTYK